MVWLEWGLGHSTGRCEPSVTKRCQATPPPSPGDPDGLRPMESISTRSIGIAGVTMELHGALMKRVARKLTDVRDAFAPNSRVLIRDRGC